MSWMPYVAQPYWGQPPIITPIITNDGGYNQVQSFLGTVPYPIAYFDPGAFQSAGVIHAYSSQFFSQLLPPSSAEQMAMQSTLNFRPPLHPPLAASNQELEVRSDPEEGSQPSISARESVSAEGHQAKTKTVWSDEDVAKLIRIKAENFDQMTLNIVPELGGKYTAKQINRKISQLYQTCRTESSSLETYVGKEGLTSASLKQFISLVPKKINCHKKGKVWSDINVAKLIRLKVKHPNESAQFLASKFEGKFNESQVRSKISFLYNECRKDNKCLDVYVENTKLKKLHLEKFIKGIPEHVRIQRRVEWHADDVVKLIKLKLKRPAITMHELSSKFGNRYDTAQINSQLGHLKRQAQKDPSYLVDRYDGKEDLTKEDLDKFIKKIP